jgi:hypothetical protein
VFEPGDKVRILKGMMMDVGAHAEVVGHVTYKIRILSRKENVIREAREDELELVERAHKLTWPPVPDDSE